MEGHPDIRIIAVPYDSGHPDRRMGTGPQHLLDNGFVESLRPVTQDERSCSARPGPPKRPSRVGPWNSRKCEPEAR
jgi:hypothetical protein